MTEIAYVAGEASGDKHAAALHRALLASCPPGETLTAWGIGGSGLHNEGVQITQDSSHWGSIGVVASLSGLPMYSAALRRMKALLLNRRPQALILVDFGFFNVRLARWARKNGIDSIIFYQPPGSWKKRSKPEANRELGQLADLIITPFPWSAENLRAAGANVHWPGHPLVDIVKPSLPAEEFDKLYGVDERRPIITLLPGSRRAEVAHLLPMMLRAASLIDERVPGSQFLLAAAPNLDRRLLERMLEREQASRAPDSKFRIIGCKLSRMAATAIDAAIPSRRMVTSEGFLLDPAKGAKEEKIAAESRQKRAGSAPTLAIVENLTYDCLERADIVVACSGTATLEAAVLNRPMLIVYKVSKMMELEFKLRKSVLDIDFIGLPNIIAGSMVTPELLQDDATPEKVSEMVVSLLIQPEKRAAAKEAIQRSVKPALGEPGMIDRSAGLIWACMQGKRN